MHCSVLDMRSDGNVLIHGERYSYKHSKSFLKMVNSFKVGKACKMMLHDEHNSWYKVVSVQAKRTHLSLRFAKLS